MNPTIMIDMDDTIADFGNAKVFGDKPVDDTLMYEPGFFRNLELIPGALVAVRALIKMGYNVQILTQPVAISAHSYSEKVEWLGMHFPELLQSVNMVQDKGVVVANYLIDDNATKWKDRFEKNGGKFIHFKYQRGANGHAQHRKNWEDIVDYFKTLKGVK